MSACAVPAAGRERCLASAALAAASLRLKALEGFSRNPHVWVGLTAELAKNNSPDHQAGAAFLPVLERSLFSSRSNRKFDHKVKLGRLREALTGNVTALGRVPRHWAVHHPAMGHAAGHHSAVH